MYAGRQPETHGDRAADGLHGEQRHHQGATIRRRTILWCTLWFSLFTALCYIAPNAEIFGALRFITGRGLGGLVPRANPRTSEFVSVRTRSAVSTIRTGPVPLRLAGST